MASFFEGKMSGAERITNAEGTNRRPDLLPGRRRIIVDGVRYVATDLGAPGVLQMQAYFKRHSHRAGRLTRDDMKQK